MWDRHDNIYACEKIVNNQTEKIVPWIILIHQVYILTVHNTEYYGNDIIDEIKSRTDVRDAVDKNHWKQIIYSRYDEPYADYDPRKNDQREMKSIRCYT